MKDLPIELQWLNSPYLLKAQIAYDLFDAKTDKEKAQARSYFRNKLENNAGKKLSEEEKKKLFEIKKKIIQSLV